MSQSVVRNQKRFIQHHCKVPALAWLALGATLLGGLLIAGGCESTGRRGGFSEVSYYPPAPQPAQVVALGSLQLSPGPSESELAVSEILFGEPLTATLPVVLPSAVAVTDGATLVCDSARSALLSWQTDSKRLQVMYRSEAQARPHDVAVFDGGVVIADQSGASVIHRTGGKSGDGSASLRFRVSLPDGGPVGGVAVYGDHLYCSDPRGHQVVVYDLTSGAQQQVLGAHGTGPGEFAHPRGIAVTPRGDLIVVDTLNNRVQKLSPSGKWIRDIGGPGQTVGSFGRPRDVAIAPDGNIFVTDAFSQRVHAFNSEGEPLLAIGEPGSGLGALALPLGIAVTRQKLPTLRPLPAGYEADYYILVAEQLRGPGVRAYAWLKRSEADLAAADEFSTSDWQPSSPELAALNPHFDPMRCEVCHTPELGPGKIASERIDTLCVSCHDGVRAPADPHPIGRPAMTETVSTPSKFPTPGDLLGCISCHDIVQQCSKSANQRPARNPQLLRFYDPQQRLDYCAECHSSSIGARFSPHEQYRDDESLRTATCNFCHTQIPDVPPDGRRRFEPHLRTATSDLCMNCHDPHWDLSPRGHVDRPMTDEILAKLLAQESRLGAHGRMRPTVLPLGENDTVTCYTCHNPHHPQTFPAGTELASYATDPRDRLAHLRTNWLVLCSACHER
jgi:predicted CXXCH cytochrome family protein